jgi:hypothetical protein
MSRFYEVGPIGEIATNLFHGYGYNFYRAENQLRADDQRVRELACSLLGRARGAIVRAESDYRRENIPPPSRANPFPDPAAVAEAQRLERLAHAVGALEGQIRHQPVPENDRMTQRYREELATLERLAEKDALLVGQAELLRLMVDGTSASDILMKRSEIDEGLAAIGQTLRERQAILV